jgi:hypothetical protein
VDVQVEDDVVDCVMVQDEKCEDETIGYTTQKKCQKWPRSGQLLIVQLQQNFNKFLNLASFSFPQETRYVLVCLN